MGKVVAAIDQPSGVPNRVELLSDHYGRARVASLSLGDEDPLTALGKRTEIVGPIEPLQVERWYAWSYFIPETWQASRTVISQFHETEDQVDFAVHPPALAFQTQLDGTVTIRNAFDRNVATTPSSYQVRPLASYELDIGRWTTIAMHVLWTPSDNGFMKIYKNGQVIFTENGHPNTFNDSLGPGFKAGLYDPEQLGVGVQTIQLAGYVSGDAGESLATITSHVPEPLQQALWLAGLMTTFLFATTIGRRSS